jgi:hypothetical protein
MDGENIDLRLSVAMDAAKGGAPLLKDRRPKLSPGQLWVRRIQARLSLEWPFAALLGSCAASLGWWCLTPAIVELPSADDEVLLAKVMASRPSQQSELKLEPAKPKRHVFLPRDLLTLPELRFGPTTESATIAEEILVEGQGITLVDAGSEAVPVDSGDAQPAVEIELVDFQPEQESPPNVEISLETDRAFLDQIPKAKAAADDEPIQPMLYEEHGSGIIETSAAREDSAESTLIPREIIQSSTENQRPPGARTRFGVIILPRTVVEGDGDILNTIEARIDK